MAETVTVPNVKYIRKELTNRLPQYTIIRDCIAGEEAIKAKKDAYLPQPNKTDLTPANSARYDAYIKRAVFYNVTERTLSGLCGQIFMRDTLIEVPEALKIVVNDADGSGVSLEQLAKSAAQWVIGYGRAGLFVDYPATDGPITKAQLQTGNIRPVIQVVDPQHITNWRVRVRGAKRIYDLVVIKETYVASDDGFEAKEEDQWRVLRLDGDVYKVQIWRETKVGRRTTMGFTEYTPLDADGEPFDEIPFTFIGAVSNDERVDKPPMYDIAILNVAHYRNSADYEESCFLTGQPTPVFTGLTEDWVKNVLNGTVQLGSRSAISLPVGAAAQLLQAQENGMVVEAMKHKEEQMKALGARLVESKTVVQTATEDNNDKTTEESVLAAVAKNVSRAFGFSLEWCAYFMGESEKGIKFLLNTDFDIARMSPEARRQLLLEWQGGGLTFAEYRAAMRKSGIATEDDEEARETIKQEMMSLPDMNTGGAGGGNGAGG